MPGSEHYLTLLNSKNDIWCSFIGADLGFEEPKDYKNLRDTLRINIKPMNIKLGTKIPI